MLSSAEIFVCKSRVLTSFAATVRLSSAAADPIAEILRLIRSGDCTIRERVREMFSDAVFIALFTFSCGDVSHDSRKGHRRGAMHLLRDECGFLLLEALDVLQETHLAVFVRDNLLHECCVLLPQGFAFRFVLSPLDSNQPYH